MRLAAREPHRSGSGPRSTAGARSRQAAAVSAVAALAMLLTAACGSAHPTDASVATPEPALPAPPSPPATSPPVTDVVGATGPAVLAYRAFWEDAVYANAHAGYWNADTRTSLGVGGTLYALFFKHATGSALEQQRVSVYDADRSGHFSQGRPVLQPTVTAAVPAAAPVTVRLRDCLDDSQWLVHVRATGALLDHRPGRRHPVVVTMARTSSGWKVADLVIRPLPSAC